MKSDKTNYEDNDYIQETLDDFEELLLKTWKCRTDDASIMQKADKLIHLSKHNKLQTL